LTTAPSTLELGRQEPAGPQVRLLRSVYETFARTLTTRLSTFLQSEITASLGEISFVEAAEFRNTLSPPSCLITLKLYPRQERMTLHFDASTVLSLLELLLGGSGNTLPAEPRELTEIEWSLLEEVVRVLVGVLGEAWQPFVAVEFEVESLGSDPAALHLDGARALMRARFSLQLGQETGMFELAVPRTMFEAPGPSPEPDVMPTDSDPADVQRNLGLLEDAQVELEVRLQGPTLAVREILALQAGQVLTFDYSLNKSVHGLVNGNLAIMGQIVSAGRRRAFQVEQLP
jgi:flagellar motor switch protein FliM